MRLEPDTRPISKQVMSGLKIGAVLIATAIISLLILQLIPLNRIEAYYWHLRHGTSVAVGSYRFPVPEQWYVHSDSADDVILVNLKTGDRITVRVSSEPNRHALAAWEALTSRPVPNDRMKVLGRKVLQIHGETIVCIEKNLDTTAVRLYPIECHSESNLQVTFQPYLFSAKNHDQMFYSLLKQVQKL